ncbi:MAG: hypothetical protein AMXMBFR13_32440 [Phycisphaerae bacterium]
MPVTARRSDLLDPEFMARLEQLDIVSRKIFAGKMKGERRSKRKGQSVEFADYRNYSVGDDLRFLDWNIYGRLERLFIKLFFEEEDLHVNLLVDASKSMDFGEPAKALYAKRVAAAIAYIGLVNYNRVTVSAFSDRYGPEMAGIRGRRLIHQVLGFLSDLPVEGAGHMAAACRHFAIRHPQRGIVVVLSDFMDKGGYETALRYLVGRRYDLYVIQMLSPAEIEPDLAGDLRLRDVEDDDLAEVTVSRALLNRYKQNLNAYCGGLRDFCTRRGITYMFTSTAVPFDQLVLNYLRRRGLLR